MISFQNVSMNSGLCITFTRGFVAAQAEREKGEPDESFSPTTI